MVRETEIEVVKDQVLKRIHQASLEADTIQFRSVPPDNIAAYGCMNNFIRSHCLF